jgi:hypothetical protein
MELERTAGWEAGLTLLMALGDGHIGAIQPVRK